MTNNDIAAASQRAAAACLDTSICEPECISTLNSVLSTFGCCFISGNNGTDSPPMSFLSYDFFQRCGLTSPGPCDVLLDTSPNRISAPNFMNYSLSAFLRASKVTISIATIAMVLMNLY